LLFKIRIRYCIRNL